MREKIREKQAEMLVSQDEMGRQGCLPRAEQSALSESAVEQTFLSAHSESVVEQTFLSAHSESVVEQTFLSAHPFRPVETDAVHPSRRRLPHWHQQNRIFFVTFRLADSISQKKLAQWKEEAACLDREVERNRLYLKRQQSWLDKGSGSCVLKDPAVSEVIERTLLHFDRERYLLGEYVIMPNHIHLMVQPLEGYSLPQIIKSWKGYSSREINRLCGSKGTLWMDEYFDHMVRSESYFEKFQNYIRRNPEKVGLSDSSFRLGCGELRVDRQTGMSAPQEETGRQGCLPHVGQETSSARCETETVVEQTLLSAHSETESVVEQTLLSAHSETESVVEQTLLSAHSETESVVEQTFLSAHSETESVVEQTLLSAHSESVVEQTFLSAQAVVALLSAPRRIHMLGIGGIGMAGLAFLLKERGHIVSGSDAQKNRQTDWLRAKGVSIQNEVPPDTEWIIRTRAVPDSHPDVIAATVPVSWRGEVLPALLRDRFTIAVSGTHGKTTTSSMIAQILDCGYCIGGEVDGFDGVARDGEIMVVEADESDGTVANYHPDIAVITNIEYDHMEHHDSVESFEGCFKQFIAQTKEKIIYCAEDPAATRLCSDNPKAVPYGLHLSNFKCQISLPGRHNQLNACAALAVCRHLKCPEAVSFQTLENLKPVKRRFEVVFDTDYTVVSDYAHHPTEIRALIDTAFETLKPKRLFGVFQPHRYTRTLALGPDFASAFQGLEKLWLLPVYAASEDPIEGGTTEDLMAHFSRDWKNRIKIFQSLEKTWQDIQLELGEGDVLLIIGAGDIVEMERWIKGEKERRVDGALG